MELTDLRRVVVGVLLFMAACGPGESEPRSYPVHDLEGDLERVAVVGLGEGAFRPVGATDAGPTPLFASLAAAADGGGGDVVAVDRGARAVRIFRDDGTLRAEVGRLGEGPGEFQRPSWVGRCSPTTFTVLDLSLDRLSGLTLDGELVGVRRVEATPGYSLQEVRCSDDGTYVFASRDLSTIRDEPGRYSVPFLLETATGLDGTIRPIGLYHGEERYRYPTSDLPAPLGATLSFDLAGGTVFLADGGTAAVVAIDVEDGDTVGLWRWSEAGREVSSDIGDGVVEDDLALVRDRVAPPVLAERRSLWRDTEFPEKLPEVHALFIDEEEQMVWVQTDRPPHSASPINARAMGVPIGSQSSLVLSLELPRGLQLLDVEAGRAIGRKVTELGVHVLEARPIVGDSLVS
jgi:hypothetical protein